MALNIKNTAKKSIWTSDSISCFSLENSQLHTTSVEQPVSRDSIQFFFGMEGESELAFNGEAEGHTLAQNHSLFLYNPVPDKPLHIDLKPGAQVFAIHIQIDAFHRLFDAEDISFVGAENAKNKYHIEREMSPSMAVVLSQLTHCDLRSGLRLLYAKAKVYELLCLYFQSPPARAEANCPFLLDAENVHKIRQAKGIIIENMTDPPSLKSLARRVGLNEYRLKVGFKNIYGKTIYGFLMDYKMEYARKLIEGAKFQTQTIAYRLGYENPSHFIAAFKKKYGITPKKYATTKMGRV
ncbi:MAG: AraC family transcriptional regulator [Flavobacteriales bacterium]